MTTIANVLVLGDSNVGKTSLIHRLKYNRQLESPSSTVGVEFTTIHIGDRAYHIWDVEGIHTLSLISTNQFKHIFIVCEASNPSTVEPYLMVVQRHEALITLVANKCDTYANRPNGYLCTSAHTGLNLDQIRLLLTRSQLGNENS